jgi:hypothetical protein
LFVLYYELLTHTQIWMTLISFFRICARCFDVKLPPSQQYYYGTQDTTKPLQRQPTAHAVCLTAVTPILYVQLQKALTLNSVLQWYQHAHSTWYCSGTNTRAEPNLLTTVTPLEYPGCSCSRSKYKQRKFALPALKPAFLAYLLR